MERILGCTWEVVKRYELTDEYMKEHGLFYKKRITLRCTGVPEGCTGVQVGEIRDFANTTNL